MSDIECEDIAQMMGLKISVGNWITPEGKIIYGHDYEHHHWETIKNHLKQDSSNESNLSYMNSLVEKDHYIRIVLRSNVWFQVGGDSYEDIWTERADFITMRYLLSTIPQIESHIFSSKFCIVGSSDKILKKDLSFLEIKTCRKNKN